MGMEQAIDPTPLPLRISKAPRPNQSHLLKTGPPFSIPRRSSSFAIHIRDTSTTSTTTPPLENVNKITIPKTRRDESLPSKQRFLSLSGEDDTIPPFLDDIKSREEPASDTVDDPPEKTPYKGGIFSRILHSFDPRPRAPSKATKGDQAPSLLTRLSTSLIHQFPKGVGNDITTSTSTSIDENDFIPFFPGDTWEGISRQKTPPLVRPILHVPRNRKKTGARLHQTIPITTANMELLTDTLADGDGDDIPLWLTTEVTAAVGMGPTIDGDTLLPLDVVIVVDNSATAPDPPLKDAYDNAVLVAAETANGNDRVAICCVYNQHEPGLTIVLPLAMNGIDIIKRALDSMPHTVRPVNRGKQDDFDEALREASNFLLQYSNRGAFYHVFLVTTETAVSLPSCRSHHRVQFHTVSPSPIFESGPSGGLNGYHLAYGKGFSDNPIAEQAQFQKINLIFQQLRTGYDPGTLSDLTINFKSGNGYAIESILGDMTCKALRPGEKWTIIVKTKARLESIAERMEGDYFDLVDELMDELYRILEGRPAYDDTILYASLEYRHSCLPNSALVKLERRWEAPEMSRTAPSPGIVKGYEELCARDSTVAARDSTGSLSSEVLSNGHEGSPGSSPSSIKKGSQKKLSSNRSPYSNPQGIPRDVLGDATNKSRYSGNRENDDLGKSSRWAVNRVRPKPENERPTSQLDQKTASECMTANSVGVAENLRYEQGEIEWG